jgi:hypothetical protein
MSEGLEPRPQILPHAKDARVGGFGVAESRAAACSEYVSAEGRSDPHHPKLSHMPYTKNTLMVTQISQDPIEKLFYIASLVTKVEDIDPLLDTVRFITSKSDYQTVGLTDAERATVADVQRQLEAYLVTMEQLRYFTPDSLQLQIEQHMSGGGGSASRTKLMSVLVLAVLLSASLAIFLPLDDVQQRGQVGGSVAFSIVNMGAAWLFLTALPAFRSSLRKAFLLICIGTALIGLSLLGHPIVEALSLRHYPLTSLLLPLPLLIAATVFWWGNVRYGRLIGVTGKWTTALPVLVASLVAVLFTWFVPHRSVNEPEIVFDLAAVMWGVMLVMPLASTFVLPATVRKLPEVYKPSARALSLAMWPIIAVILYQYVLRVVAGPFMNGPVAYGLFALVIVMGITLLRAGYMFNKVSRY